MSQTSFGQTKQNAESIEFRNQGNAHYKKKKNFDALLCYNLAICHAELGSEELAIAYANRSAVYFEVGLYEKCLKNIQHAIDNGYPAGKLKILEDRRQRGTKLMETNKTDPHDDSWNFFKLSYEPNPNIPFLAGCLELRNGEIFTSRDLKGGDIVAITDSVFRFPDPTARLHRCSYCFADCLLDLVPCNGCTKAMFCSDDCMKRADFHSIGCSEFKLSKNIESEARENYFESKIMARILSIVDGSWTDMKEFLLSLQNKKWTHFDFDWNNLNKRAQEENLLKISLSLPEHRLFVEKLISRSSPETEIIKCDFRSDPVLNVHSCIINLNEEIKFKGENRCNKILVRCVYLNYYGEVKDPMVDLMQNKSWKKANVCHLSVSNKLVFMTTTPISAGQELVTERNIGYPKGSLKQRECLYSPKTGYSYAIPNYIGHQLRMSIIKEPVIDSLYINHYGADGCTYCKPFCGSKPSGLSYIEKTTKVEAANAFKKNCEIMSEVWPSLYGYDGSQIDLNVLNLEVLKKPASFYP